MASSRVRLFLAGLEAMTLTVGVLGRGLSLLGRFERFVVRDATV